MAKITFALVKSNTDSVDSIFGTLKSLYEYARLKYTDFGSYHIEELEDGEMVETCNLSYFMNSYKVNKITLNEYLYDN